ERTELRTFFAYNDTTKVEEILSMITEEVEKVEFLRRYVSKSREGSTKKRRIEESQKPYIASDRHSVKLPSQIINILNSSEFVPEPRTKFTAVLQNLEVGQNITLLNFGQEPKHFALGYQRKKLFVTNQIIDMWSLLSKDDGNSIKRVLLEPMGVEKSYLAFFLAAKAYSKGWLMLYISDAAELIKPSMEMASKEICKRFLAINKDILTANELKGLVEFVSEDDVFVTCTSLIWDLLKQKDRKTLLVVDEHGVLFNLDPPVPDRLIILISLKYLNFWGEKAAGSRVIFAGTAHAKFEKTYLINDMHNWWVEYVCSLTEEVFDKLLDLHPFLKKPSIAPKVKRIVNCVPRKFIYFAEYVKDSSSNYVPDERIDILLESFQND
ncbi:3328_t:CDS:2, partial [Funneliformis caledonium]